jgi:hypothetical protein
LVAFARFQCLVPNWRFQCLVVFEKRRRNILFISSHFPPLQIVCKPSFFPLILRFYFTMILNRYFTPFLLFPWLINYNHTSQYTKFSTHSPLNWFWLRYFFLSLNSWRHTWPLLTGFKLHEWMKNHLRNHP